MQDEAFLRGGLTDDSGLDLLHDGLVGTRELHRGALGNENVTQLYDLRRPHRRGHLGVRLQDGLHRSLGKELAPPNDDQVIRGDGHLVHQMA